MLNPFQAGSRSNENRRETIGNISRSEIHSRNKRNNLAFETYALQEEWRNCTDCIRTFEVNTQYNEK